MPSRSLSVVIPVRNEEPNVLPLAAEVEAALAHLPAWECIWVDDASTDGTHDALLRLLREGSPHRVLVLPEHRDRMRRHYLDGPADIVVEVVSPESRQRDRVEKLAEYQAAGVTEYWLIDAEGGGAEFRLLGPDGRYRVVLAGAAGPYRSAVLPSLRLRVEWLWQEPGPDYDEVLRTLGAG